MFYQNKLKQYQKNLITVYRNSCLDSILIVHSLIIWKLQTINFITICLSYWMIFNEKQMSRVVTKKWWKIRLLKLRSTNLHKTFPWIFLWQSATFSAILQNICETCLWSQNEQIFFCAFLPCRAEEIISRR